MSKVEFIQSARKDWTCSRCGAYIPKGSPHYQGEGDYIHNLIRCVDCSLVSYEVEVADHRVRRAKYGS